VVSPLAPWTLVGVCLAARQLSAGFDIGLVMIGDHLVGLLAGSAQRPPKNAFLRTMRLGSLAELPPRPAPAAL
jgi:hypothetical protein